MENIGSCSINRITLERLKGILDALYEFGQAHETDGAEIVFDARIWMMVKPPDKPASVFINYEEPTATE